MCKRYFSGPQQVRWLELVELSRHAWASVTVVLIQTNIWMNESSYYCVIRAITSITHGVTIHQTYTGKPDPECCIPLICIFKHTF